MTSATPTPEEAMTETDPEQVDPQEQYLQEQEAAAAAPVAPAPDTRRQRPRSTLPVISEAEALDRIAAMLAGEDLEGAPALSAIDSIIRDTGRQPAEVSARLARPSRLDRLRAFAEGDSRIDRVQVDAYGETYRDSALPRFALIESSPTGAWLTLHDTPEGAATYHEAQPYGADCPIEKLIDLDTGAQLTAETKTSVTWSSP
jgi:hypothetical protein